VAKSFFFQKCGRDSFVRFVAVRVGVATWVNKLTLRLSPESVCWNSTFYLL